jgi:hypothetical protein
VPTDITPSHGAAIKLASIAVHADEMIDGLHAGTVQMEDEIAIRSLLSDHEVMAYMLKLGKLGLLPVKRDGE